MSFEDEMNDVKNAETSANYIKKAGIEIVTIKGYKMSPSDHKGCPFIEFTFETIDDSKSINTTRLYRVRETDSVETKEYKNKRLKELLENAGADFALKGEQVVKSSVGKQVQALFKTVEYIGYDNNNNNRPEIRTKVEYSFSAKVGDTINGNQSYLFSALREKDMKKYQGDLAKWDRDFPSGQAAPIAPPAEPENTGNQEDEDDLPF